jgi:hypothetical protein
MLATEPSAAIPPEVLPLLGVAVLAVAYGVARLGARGVAGG